LVALALFLASGAAVTGPGAPPLAAARAGGGRVPVRPCLAHVSSLFRQSRQRAVKRSPVSPSTSRSAAASGTRPAVRYSRTSVASPYRSATIRQASHASWYACERRSEPPENASAEGSRDGTRPAATSRRSSPAAARTPTLVRR